MAWNYDYSRKHRKEAGKALRSNENREAIKDQIEEKIKPGHKKHKKPYGLKHFYTSMWSGDREYSWTEWYATERDRDQARRHMETHKLPWRTSRFEKVER